MHEKQGNYMSKRKDREKQCAAIRTFIVARLDAGDLLANIRQRDVATCLGVTPRNITAILGEPWGQYISSARFSKACDGAARVKGITCGALRQRQVLNVAIQLAELRGLAEFDRKEIEKAIHVSGVTVYNTFRASILPPARVNSRNVANMIAAAAIERGSYKVIGEAVAMRLPAVADLPIKEKRKALLSILKP